MEMEQPTQRTWKLNTQLMIAVMCFLVGIALLLWTFVIGPLVVKPTLTPFDVTNQFKNAGLEAENPVTLTPQDYGAAPKVCTGERFFMPSVGAEQSGMVFVCSNAADRDALQKYYEALNKQDPAHSSWVMVYNLTLVQLSGDLPEPQARRYEAIIRNLP